MVNIEQIAHLACVSTATVSHVLNGSAKVSPKLKARVLKVVRDLNYHPNYLARSLRTRETKTVGMVITDITNAVQSLGLVQGNVGDGENDLTYAIGLANSQITNQSAAESNIRDANIAQEATLLTQSQVLQQSSVSALAQANSEPQALLKLLQ